MPIYKKNNRTFNIPEDIMGEFEKDNPDASIMLSAGGRDFTLPLSVRDEFQRDIKDWTYTSVPDSNAASRPQQAPAESTAVAAPQPLAAPVVAGQDDTIRGFGESFNQSAESMYRGGQMTAGEIARVYGGSREDYTRAKDMIDDVASGKSRQETAYGRAVENMDMIQDEMDAARREEREYRRNVGKGWDDVRSMWRGWKRQRNLRKRYLSANEVTDPTTAEGTMFGRAYKLAADALEDAGGDKDKAIAALTEGESRDTWGDRQVDAAVEAIQGFRPTEGFGAFVGGLVPQMIGNAVAVGLSMNPVTAAFAAPVGMANMGMLTLASAGGAMADAESYRREGNDVSHGDIMRSGLTAAAIEAGTEMIPFNRYFNSARKVLGRRLGKEVAQETLSSPAATAELTSLLSKHRDEMPRSIINKMNVREYGKDVVAEGLSEFLAEGGGALVQTIYSNPDDYPTLNEIIGNAWEGAKGGMFMGAFLGAGSTYASHRANLRRQEQQGFVELANTKDNGVVEIVGRGFTENDRPVYKVLKANGEVQDVAYSDIMETSKIPYDVYREYMDNPTESNLVNAAEQSYNVDMQSMRDNRRKKVNEYINIPADADIRFTKDGIPTDEIIPVQVNVGGNETTGYLLERTDGVDGQMARARVMLQGGDVITPSLSDISEGNPIGDEYFYAGHEALIDEGEDAADVTTDAIKEAQAEVQAQQAAQEQEARDRQAEYESASPERRAQMDREDFAARIAQNPNYDEQVYQSTLNRKGEIEWNRLGAEQTFVAESRTHGEETAAKDAIREVGRLRAEAARAADAVAKAENESKSIAQINSLRQKSEQAKSAVTEWEKVLNERGVPVPQTTPVQQMQQETAQEEVQTDSGQNVQERQDAAQGNIPKDNIPRDNDGNIDYDVLLDTDPAMFMQRYSEEFGADAAAEEVSGIISSIDAQIEKNDKALAKETSATKRAALRRQNAALDARRQALGSLVQPQEAVTEEAAPVSEMQEQNTAQTAQENTAGQDLFTLGNDNARVGDVFVQNEPAVPQSISEEDVDIIVGEMEANAVAVPEIELTPANWNTYFGDEGKIQTPIGIVKMGENQITKFFSKGRERDFGMVAPTLSDPDVIIEKRSDSPNAERNTKYLFVKSFVKPDGSRYMYFESVTVRKGGLEVSISSHQINKNTIKKEMQNGRILHLNDKLPLSSERYLTEAPVSEGPDLVPTSDNMSDSIPAEDVSVNSQTISSANKDTNSVPENQDNSGENGADVYNAARDSDNAVETTDPASDNTDTQNNENAGNVAAPDESAEIQDSGIEQGQTDNVVSLPAKMYYGWLFSRANERIASTAEGTPEHNEAISERGRILNDYVNEGFMTRKNAGRNPMTAGNDAARRFLASEWGRMVSENPSVRFVREQAKQGEAQTPAEAERLFAERMYDDMKNRVVGESTYSYNGKDMKLSYVDGYPVYSVKGGRSNVPLHVVAEDTPVSGYYEKSAAIDTFDKYVAASQERIMMASETDANGELRSANNKGHLKNLCEIAEKMRSFRKTHRDLFSDAAAVKAMDVKKSNERVRSAARNQNVDSDEFKRLKAEAYSAVQKLSSLMDEYDVLANEKDRIKSEIMALRHRDRTDEENARLDELRKDEAKNAKALTDKENDISKADEVFREARRKYVRAGGENIPRPQIVSPDAPRRATIREVQVLTDAVQRIFPRSMRSKVHVLSGERFMEQLAIRVGAGEIINDSGDVAGFVDRDGTVYINADEARIDTPLHEIGVHRLIDVAEQVGEKELYAGIIRYGRTAPESIKQYVRDKYGMDESDPLFYEEVAAAAFGIENEQGLERFLTDETSKSWFARLREWLSGLWNRLRGKTEYADRSFYQALGDMSHEEIGRRLFDMVTSGKQVFEAGKAMESFMSRAVSEGIVDTEKEERLNKLRRSEPVIMSGDEYIGNYELNRDSAKKWMRDNLRGEYTIEDTGETVFIVRSRVNKVTSHSMGDEAHLKSLYAVPEMLGKSIFIEEEAADKNNAKYPVCRYYVVGLKIGGEDYTAKITIGVDENGNKFYDHSLTEIEKTKLVDLLNRPAVGFISTGDVPDPSVTGIKDTKLLSILQNNRNIILSEYADAAAQQHRPSGSYEDGDDMINGELTNKGRVRLQRINESAQKASDALTGSPEVTSPAKWLEWFIGKGVIDKKKGGAGEWLYQWLARKSALEKVSKDDVIKKINDHSLDNNPFGRRVRSALSRKRIGNMPADKVSPRRVYQWLVDSMAPLERMQNEARRRGVRITDDSNAYVRQNLETSAAQGDMEAFSAGPIRRLTKAYTALEGHRKELEALGYTGNGAVRTAADDYLFALHAPERNRRVILNEMMQAAENRIKDLKKEDRADARKVARDYAEALYDGGGSAVAPAALPDGIADAIGKYYDSVKGTSRSGRDGMDNPLTDKRAAELLAELDRIFTPEERKALVDAAREATEWTLDYAVNTGLISYRTRDEYKSMYSHYVPLRNWDDPDTSSVREREDSKPSGRRPSLSGELDVDMEAKGRESRAASPLVTLMQSAQNTVMNGQRNRTLNALVNLYNKNALKVSDMIYVSSKDISEDKDAPAWVANMAGKSTEEGEEHSIAVRVNGVQTRIYMFGEEGEMFMSAYKRLHNGGPNGALRALGATTRFRSNILTTLNPPFWLANAERDVRFGMRALYVMRNIKFVKDTMRNIGEAFIQAFNANVNGKPSDMYSEFMRSGGRIGFFRQMDSDQIRNDMAKELNALKKNGTVDGKNVFRLMLKHTRNLASVTEELMRYATYMTARQNGESAQEAAYLAHEVTANLSRRGTQRGFSAWSSFFNATMQGMNQLYRLYRTNPGRTARVLAADMSMKLVSMLSMLAAGAAMMGGGDDDGDDEGFIARMFSPENPAWKMPEYVRKSAIVIPVGMDERGVMQGILIQNPHNFRAVTNIVDRLMAVSCGVMTGEEAAGAWARDMIDEFAPFNLSSFADNNPKNNVLMFVPSALQPAAEAWLNTTSFGGNVRADMRDSSVPKYMSAKGSTNEFYVEMSKMLNTIGGGSTAVKGTWLNVSPESIDHIMESYLGFPVKMLDAVVKEATWTDAQKHRYGGAWGGLLSNVYSGNRDRAMYQEVRRLSANVDTRIDNLLENAPLYMLEDIAGDEKTIRAIKDEMRRTANMIYSEYRPMVQELEAMYNNVLYSDRFTEEEKNRRLLQIEDGIARVNTEFGNAFDERFWEYMDKKHGKNKE